MSPTDRQKIVELMQEQLPAAGTPDIPTELGQMLWRLPSDVLIEVAWLSGGEAYQRGFCVQHTGRSAAIQKYGIYTGRGWHERLVADVVQAVKETANA